MDSSVFPVLAFYNVISEELSVEDSQSVLDLRPLLPIVSRFVETGLLGFTVFNDNDECFGFASAVQTCFRFNENNVNGSNNSNVPLSPSSSPSASSSISFFPSSVSGVRRIVASLNPVSADQGNVIEATKVLAALMYKMSLTRPTEFESFSNRLPTDDVRSAVHQMMENLKNGEDLFYTPTLPQFGSETGPAGDVDILHQHDQQPPSSPHTSLSAADAALYKLKSCELESRLKQSDQMNDSLNTQLNTVQTEYADLEHKYDSMNSSLVRKQASIDELRSRVKELEDDLELVRYENGQLQREVRATTEAGNRTAEKLVGELREKCNELGLLYRRLDEYVKQMAEKEGVEKRLAFIDQQLANARGYQDELNAELATALNRANTAETELGTLKKQHLHADGHPIGRSSSTTISQSQPPSTTGSSSSSAYPSTSSASAVHQHHHFTDANNASNNDATNAAFAPAMFSSFSSSGGAGAGADNNTGQGDHHLSLHDELNKYGIAAPLPASSFVSSSSPSVQYSGGGGAGPGPSTSTTNCDDTDNDAASTEVVVAQLKTKIDLLLSENRHLKKANEHAASELALSRSADSQSFMEKAVEVERLRQGCDELRDSLAGSRQKEVVAEARSSALQEENAGMRSRVAHLESTIDKAQRVIAAYSTNVEGYECAADVLSLRAENETLVLENQRLVARMDQFKHEATQEQRLITTHWYQTQLEKFQLQHCLGAAATNGKDNNNNHNNNNNHSSIKPQEYSSKGSTNNGSRNRRAVARMNRPPVGRLHRRARSSSASSPLSSAGVATAHHPRRSLTSTTAHTVLKTVGLVLLVAVCSFAVLSLFVDSTLLTAADGPYNDGGDEPNGQVGALDRSPFALFTNYYSPTSSYLLL